MVMKMKEYIIKLDSKGSAYEFCSICSRFDGDVDVSCGKYSADAKSLLGVYGLPRNTELTVRTNFFKNEDNEQFREKIGQYIVR